MSLFSLCQSLALYVAEDETNIGLPGNEYYVGIRVRACRELLSFYPSLTDLQVSGLTYGLCGDGGFARIGYLSDWDGESSFNLPFAVDRSLALSSMQEFIDGMLGTVE